MTFENMWPLLFLIAVPIIIILYILRPKGVERRNSSNLLWSLLVKNRAAKTTFEKFVKNILMFVQILLTLLLVFALMSPFIKTEGVVNDNVILLFDTSYSMQTENGKGETRLEEAISDAKGYIKGSTNTTYTILARNAGNTQILAVGATDAKSVTPVLENITPSMDKGDLVGVADTIESLMIDENGEKNAKIIIFTDGNGLQDAKVYADRYGADVMICGEASYNLSNDYTVCSAGTNGYDIMVSVTNYSDVDAQTDVTIFDNAGNILAVSPLKIAPGQSAMCFVEDVDTQASGFYSELSGIRFDGKASDSLPADNKSYGVASLSTQINAALVGGGNTYLEKAVSVISGTTPVVLDNARSAYRGTYTTLIFDKGTFQESDDYGTVTGRIIFDGEDYKDTASRVKINFEDTPLTKGMKGFSLGVNEVRLYELPTWAKPFMTYDDQVVAYYGEHDGVRDVVIGFDIRETDFALLAEFPVFMANTLSYLAGTEILDDTIYFVGEPLTFEPGVDQSKYVQFTTQNPGLYNIGTTEEPAFYAVRLRTATESNTFVDAEDITSGKNQVKTAIVKRALRNIFIIAALVILLVEWIIYVRQMRYRGKFYLITHIITAALLVLALIGISIPKFTKSGVTVFVADLSYSNESRFSEMENYIADMVEKMPANNQYGIVCFGKDAKVEQFLTEKHSVGGFMSSVDANATDLEDAIYRGAAMLPSDAAGRIVLLTDGKQTMGNIENTVSMIQSSNIELLCLLYENTTSAQDAYIDDVETPSYLHPGDEYTITVTVNSNYETPATLYVYAMDEKGQKILPATDSREVNLSVGTNRFAFTRVAGLDSAENFVVEVEALGDGCEQNDGYMSSCSVEAAPKTLVILGNTVDGIAFRKVLDAAGADYEMVEAKAAPKTMADFLNYKEIILDNVFIYDLPDAFLDKVESYVKDYGGGLICVGGEQSYAMGGYRNTVLEDVLPVQMEIDGTLDVVKTAMVFVVDHSGSMSTYDDGARATYLDVAITATIEAISVMRASDYVGVLSFDDGNTWNVPLQLVGDGKAAIEGVKTITDGGGTVIDPALQDAFEALNNIDAAVKHVVLLTDGYGEYYDVKDYQQTLDKYIQSGITLSTVSIGDWSDEQLMESMANYVGGRYYHATAASNVPKIFTQEVFLSGDSYIQNGNFVVTPTGSSEITDGLFPNGWPTLFGYINTKAKPGSRKLLISDQNDPLLTVWQYGLGITCAFASDTEGLWTGGYSSEDDYALLWKRITDYCAGVSGLGEDTLRVEQEGSQTKITYHANEYTGQTSVTAYYVDQKGEVQEIKLYATAPGVYESYVETAKTGVYQFNVRRSEGDEVINAVTASTVVQYADEYRFENTNDACKIFVQKNGAMITEKDNVWKTRVESVREKTDLTNILMIAALVLFVIDVALRRLQITPGRRKKASYVPAMAGETVVSIENAAQPSGKRKVVREDAGMEPARKKGTANEDLASQIEGVLQKRNNPSLGGTEKKVDAPAVNQVVQVQTTSANGSVNVQNVITNIGTGRPAKPKKVKAQESDLLDVSSLLKKKDERNM
ncbi:MAG: VWA domain-containing protein [Lachnospiraceae bacterium]|nr:VWA domain-containing protein [Lachnospiraceae bacterium]